MEVELSFDDMLVRTESFKNFDFAALARDAGPPCNPAADKVTGTLLLGVAPLRGMSPVQPTALSQVD